MPEGASKDASVALAMELGVALEIEPGSCGCRRRHISDVVGEDAADAAREGRRDPNNPTQPAPNKPMPPVIARLGEIHNLLGLGSRIEKGENFCEFEHWKSDCQCQVARSYVMHLTTRAAKNAKCICHEGHAEQMLRDVLPDIEKEFSVSLPFESFWWSGMSNHDKIMACINVVKAVVGGCQCGDPSCRFVMPMALGINSHRPCMLEIGGRDGEGSAWSFATDHGRQRPQRPSSYSFCWSHYCHLDSDAHHEYQSKAHAP